MARQKNENGALELIRQATIGAPTKHISKKVLLNGVEIELRQASVFDTAEATKKALYEDSKGKQQIDHFIFNINILIASCYVPGTDVKVYSDTDIDVLRECPADGYVSQLISQLNRLSDISEDAIKKS